MKISGVSSVDRLDSHTLTYHNSSFGTNWTDANKANVSQQTEDFQMSEAFLTESFTQETLCPIPEYSVITQPCSKEPSVDNPSKHSSRSGMSTTWPKTRSKHETYMIVSIVVTLCFNIPFGLLALFFSWRAFKHFEDGNLPEGRFNARVALALGMSGLVVAVCVVMLVVVYVTRKDVVSRSS